MRCREIGSRTLVPKSEASPLVAFTKPSRTFMVVVLPAPLGPRKPKTSPCPTERFRPYKATFVPDPSSFERYSTRSFLIFKMSFMLRGCSWQTLPFENSFISERNIGTAWEKLYG